MPKRIFTLVLTLAATLCQAAALDLNTATEAELDSIKGVGPAMSSKILRERKKAAFKDWHDFTNRVAGIGLASAAKFSSAGITVNGQPFAPPTLAKPQAAASQP